MKLLCAKSLGIRGSMATIVEENIKENKEIAAISNDIFQFAQHSILLPKSASLHCVLILAAATGDEIDLECFASDLAGFADLVVNRDVKKEYNVKIPHITVFQGMTSKSLCDAMIQLSKGVQGKIVISNE